MLTETEATTTTCGACGLELEGARCHAESKGHIIDREGRHFGACWGGRFPTSEGEAEWRATLVRRLKEAAAAAPAQTPAVSADPPRRPNHDEQLALTL